MRRCPECGFRANDTVCPLCGVHMTGYVAPVQTHNHKQTGERCVLPNREQPAVRQETERTYRPQSDRNKSQNPKGALTVVLVIILISVLRSCIGIG